MVLAQGLPVEVEAAEVAHPPGVEDEAAVPGLPVGGDLEAGAVPARGGRIVLELAGAVRHADSPPAGRRRIPVGGLGELPLAVEQKAEVGGSKVRHGWPLGRVRGDTGYSVSLAFAPAPSSAMISVLSAAKVIPSA